LVVPVEGAEPTLAAIVAHLKAAGLRNQALPERLELLDALPRNPAGKVLKRQLQDRYR
jgi:non-ribosomal peptide synthetase component E (peptide arylation enzyme)